MEFAQPERLAFLLLLPLLYLLSLPPRPKRTRVTAHLAQWLEARRKLARRPVRFRWLRFLLLAGAFLAAVLAHTGPRWPGRPGVTDLVILVDTSASMGARDGGGFVFDRARALVEGLLASVPEHVDVRIGLCGADARVLRGSRSELRRAFGGVSPGGPGRVDLEQMARELHSGTTAVFTITDGLGPTRPPAVGALRVVGARGDNAAIVACEVDDAWPLPEITVRLRVANHTGRDGSFVVQLAGGIAAPAQESVAVARDRTVEAEFRVRRGDGGRLEARIAGARDALPLDDAVAIDLPAPPQPEIVVRAAGDPSAALRAAAHALAAECGGKVVVDAGTDRAGFLLMEGGALDAPPAAGVRMLSFGTAIGDGAARTAAPRSIDWNRSHPVTAGLDLSELSVEQALVWPADGPGEILIGGEGRPLAIWRGGSDGAAVHVAFTLEESNLFKLAAFPQFVRRCFAASYGRKAEARLLPTSPLDPAESILAARAPAPADRDLPAFAVEPSGLAVPFLLLGLLLLAIRVYV